MPWPDSSSRCSAALFAADEADLDALLSEDALDGITEPCPVVSQIVEVGFADQATLNPLFGGTRDQYVNLSRVEARQADSEIVSDNQIGRHPPIFVKVTPARATEVRVKLTRTLNRGGFPAGSSTLSARERGLSHLQGAHAERRYTTDENGELLIEPGLAFSALGGGEYRVQAALVGQGFITSPNALQVKRRVYLRPVVRYRAGRGRAMNAMRAIRRQLATLGIEVKLVQSSTGAELGVREEDTLPASLLDIGARALRSSTQHVRELRPHSVAVIIGEFVNDAIAPRQFRLDLRRNAAGQFQTLPTVQLTNSGNVYLLVPLDDGSQLASATLTGGGRSVNITADKITGLNAFSSALDVNITDALPTFAGINTIRLTLSLKAINSWAVGWAYTAHPVIYLNMRDPNTDAVLAADRAEALMIHELGHKLHLTAPGDAGQPDAQAHHYPTFTSHGVHHQGPHCSQGVAAGTDLWTDAAHNAASCTMWGALKTVTAYCTECKTTLRKVDLGSGF